MKPEQLAMFDLPPAPPVTNEPKPAMQKLPKPRAKRARQKSLAVRQYVVRSGAGSCQVQAGSPSAAKYMAFQMARQMGQFLYRGGFLAFVESGISVREVRR
jgi:hypothetical protein